MDGLMDGWIDGLMDGWIDGWMDRCKHANDLRSLGSRECRLSLYHVAERRARL